MSGNTITVDGVAVPLLRIKIADEPNLIIRVCEYEKPKQDNVAETNLEDGEVENNIPTVSKATDFEVQKEVLTAMSPVLSSMLGPHWSEAKDDVVVLRKDTLISTQSIDIWFRHFHGKIDEVEHCKEVQRPQIWHLCQAAKKYGFRRDSLNEWFSKWLKHWWGRMPTLRDSQELLFPCWAFDHVQGFADVTRFLAYNSTGYVSERNPTPHRSLHLPGRVIQQLNHAKASLRTTVNRGLWRPLHSAFKAPECSCKAQTVYEHIKGLVDKGIWPLEETFRHHSMEEILALMDDFECSDDLESCCGKFFRTGFSIYPPRSPVQEVANHTRRKFHGLCLVCMDASLPATGCPEEDYWRHHEMDDFDFKCRGFRHGESTWFHSYMGQSFFKARDAWDNREHNPPI